MHLLWLQRLHSVDQIAIFEDGHQTQMDTTKQPLYQCRRVGAQRVVRSQPKHICLRELVLTHDLAPDEPRNQPLFTVLAMGFVCAKPSMATLCNDVSEPYHSPRAYLPHF